MVDPVPAATILLLRDNPTKDCEVFMVVRHHQIDFASGALVFPGGRVDDGDSDVTEHCDGTDGLDDYEIAMRVGAIREAFEESGVLLARPANDQGGPIISAERCLELTPYRDSLNQGEISLKSFLEQKELRLACDVLTLFAHWITPDMMPKRFNTHFYVTRVPESQVAEHDGTESVDSVWITAKDALAGARDGRYTVIFPTRLNIELLADSGSSTKQVINATGSRKIVSVLPITEKRGDDTYICIPADAGYRINEERMER